MGQYVEYGAYGVYIDDRRMDDIEPIYNAEAVERENPKTRVGKMLKKHREGYISDLDGIEESCGHGYE